MEVFVKKVQFGFAIALVLIFAAGNSFGETFGLATGNLTTADACGFGVGYIGGYAGIGDNGTTLFGSVTYGFSDYTEGRAKIGFFDPDAPNSDPSLTLGVDFKYEFMDYYDRHTKNPFDLAFGGFLEYVDFEGGNVLEVGANAIGSIPYRFESGRRLVPYARFNVRVERWSVDDFDSESNFRAGLNLGTKFEMSQDLHLYGELQIDGNFGLFTGVDIRAF
jgi:hypothetical protein